MNVAGTTAQRETIAALPYRAVGAPSVRAANPLDRLTPREADVLRLMAAGHSNHSIAAHMATTEKAVCRHTANIFTKLDLPPDVSTNRRVGAVLTHLQWS